mgnify:CR=1 FL=1
MSMSIHPDWLIHPIQMRWRPLHGPHTAFKHEKGSRWNGENDRDPQLTLIDTTYYSTSGGHWPPPCPLIGDPWGHRRGGGEVRGRGNPDTDVKEHRVITIGYI